VVRLWQPISSLPLGALLGSKSFQNGDLSCLLLFNSLSRGAYDGTASAGKVLVALFSRSPFNNNLIHRSDFNFQVDEERGQCNVGLWPQGIYFAYQTVDAGSSTRDLHTHVQQDKYLKTTAECSHSETQCFVTHAPASCRWSKRIRQEPGLVSGQHSSNLPNCQAPGQALITSKKTNSLRQPNGDAISAPRYTEMLAPSFESKRTHFARSITSGQWELVLLFLTCTALTNWSLLRRFSMWRNPSQSNKSLTVAVFSKFFQRKVKLLHRAHRALGY